MPKSFSPLYYSQLICYLHFWPFQSNDSQVLIRYSQKLLTKYELGVLWTGLYGAWALAGVANFWSITTYYKCKGQKQINLWHFCCKGSTSSSLVTSYYPLYQFLEDLLAPKGDSRLTCSCVYFCAAWGRQDCVSTSSFPSDVPST